MKVTILRRAAVRLAVFLWLLTAGTVACAAEAAPETIPSAAKPVGLPGYLASSWEKLSSTLAETLNLQDKQETLPESSYFSEDRTSNAKKINALLEQAIGILLQGEAGDLWQQAAKLRDRELPALWREKDDL
ncbi:MAG: hypothetical protein LBT65_11385, partial [Synergistaceae bacterium]|nr:hypothetical protein [Synergistaceae bacterium]